MAYAQDQNDYYFPDTENVSLIDSKPRYDSATYLPGLIAAGLLTLVTASMLIIGWILFSRDPSSFLLGFSIVASVAFLASIFVLFVLFKAFSFSKQTHINARSHNLDFLAFITAVLFGAFFLVAAIALFLYRPNHFNAMNLAFADKSLWESRFGGEFHDKWKEDRALIEALGFLSLAGFVLSAVSAMSIYSNHPYKHSLNISLLYISLLVAFLFAFGAIADYLTLSFMVNGTENPDYLKLLNALLGFAIVALVLCFTNAVAALFRSKSVLLIFGFLMVVLALAGLFITGGLARGIRKAGEGNTFELGRNVLIKTHQDDATEFCDSKYTPNNVGCRKEDSAVRWEGNSGQIAPLNVSCYYSAASWYTLRQIRFIMFLLFTIIFAFLAAFANFALGKDSTEEDNRLTPILPLLLVLGIMLLAVLAFGIALFFFPSIFSSFRAWDRSNDSLLTAFRPVPDDLVNRSLSGDGCSTLGEMDLFMLAKDGYYRIAVLGQGLTFENTAAILQGDPNSRKIFFDDGNSDNAFLLTFGSKQALENSLNDLQICLKSPSLHKKLYVFTELLDKPESINSRGLKVGETVPSSATYISNGHNYNENFAYSQVLDCSPICRTLYDFDRPQNKITVVGHMVVLNANDQLENYGVPEAEEVVSLYDQGNKSTPVIYKNNGEFEFLMFAYPGIEQTAIIRFRDSLGYYLENFVDIKIPPRNQLENKFDVGAIQLLTPDGKGCKNSTNFQQCAKNSSLKSGTISVTVRNGVTNELETVQVELHKFNSLTGTSLGTFTISGEKFGIGSFDYGSYSLKPLSDNFYPIQQKIALQSESLNVDLVLVPLPPTGVHRFFSRLPTAAIDYDLNLEFENSHGTKCYVNPSSKYCGFARMIKDIRKDTQNYEIIDIEKFTDANYMLYMAPAPFYVGTCPAYEASLSNRQLAREPSLFQSHKLQETHPLSTEDLQFAIFNSDSQLNSIANANGLNIFSQPDFLSAQEIFVINDGNRPNLPAIVLSIVNKFKADEQAQYANLKAIHINDVGDNNVVLSVLQKTNSKLFNEVNTLYKTENKDYQFTPVSVDLSQYTQASSDSTTDVKENNNIQEKSSEEAQAATIQSNVNETTSSTINQTSPTQEPASNLEAAKEAATQETTQLVQESSGINENPQISNETSNISEQETTASDSNPENQESSGNTATANIDTTVVPTPSILVSGESQETKESSCARLINEFKDFLKNDAQLSDDQIAIVMTNLKDGNASSSEIAQGDAIITSTINNLDSASLLTLKENEEELVRDQNSENFDQVSAQEKLKESLASLSVAELSQIIQELNKKESDNNDCLISSSFLPTLKAVLTTKLAQATSAESQQVQTFNSTQTVVQGIQSSQTENNAEPSSAQPSTSEILQNAQNEASSSTSEQTDLIVTNSAASSAQKPIMGDQSCHNVRNKMSEAPNLIGLKIKTLDQPNDIDVESVSKISDQSVQTNVIETASQSENCYNAKARISSQLENLGLKFEVLTNDNENDLTTDSKAFQESAAKLPDEDRQSLSSSLSKDYDSLNAKCSNLGSRLQTIKNLLVGEVVVNTLNEEKINSDASVPVASNICFEVQTSTRSKIQDIGVDPNLILPIGHKVDPDSLAASYQQLTEQQKQDLTAVIEQAKENFSECVEFSENLTLAGDLLSVNKSASSNGEAVVSQPYIDAIESQIKVQGVADKDILPGDNEESIKQETAPPNNQQINDTSIKSYAAKEKLSNFFKEANIDAQIIELPYNKNCFLCKGKLIQAVDQSGILASDTKGQCSIEFDADSQINCEGKPDQACCLSLKAELQKFQSQLQQNKYSPDQCQTIQNKLKDVLMNFYHNDYCFRARDKLLKVVNLYMSKIQELNSVSEEELQGSQSTVTNIQQEPQVQTNENIEEVSSEAGAEPTETETETNTEAISQSQTPLVENSAENSTLNAEATPSAENLSDQQESEQPNVSEQEQAQAPAETDQTGQEEISTNNQGESDNASRITQEPSNAANNIDESASNESRKETDEGVIIDARRLEKLSSNPEVSLPEDKFILLKCFTGFGKRSFKVIHRLQSAKPSIDTCKKMFEGSKYSLDNLLKQMAPLE